MDATDERLGRIESKQDAQGEKLDRVLSVLEQQRGARRLMGLVTVGAGSLIGFLVTWFSARP